MLESHVKKEMTRAEAIKKIEAYKTLNSVLVQSNSRFMSSLHNMLSEKVATVEGLKTKLEKGEGTEDENCEYLFTSGYVQALKDILGKQNG